MTISSTITWFLTLFHLETLRIITLLPHLSRVCTEDTKLNLCAEQSIDIAKGTIIKVPTHAFHHDEQYFVEPHVFKPERFDNAGHLEFMKKGIFLPFGDGPRICMGKFRNLIFLN